VFGYGVWWGKGMRDLAVQQMRAATKKGGVVWCAPTGGNSIVILGTNVSLHLSFVDRWLSRT